MQNIIGKRIQRRREELDMSQSQLAKLMGYKSRSSINKIEFGVSDITQSRLEDFARILRVPILYFFKKEEPDFQEYSSYLAKASAGTLAAVRKLLDMPEKPDDTN